MSSLRIDGALAAGILTAALGPLLAVPQPAQDAKKMLPTNEEIARRLGLTVDDVARLHTQRGWNNADEYIP